MGTEAFRQREKPAKQPAEVATVANLWSPFSRNYAQNRATIPGSGRNISNIGDWLAEGGVQNELPSQRTGTGSLCHAVVYRRIFEWGR